MRASKKSLLASGVALLASAALLAGTTFAWFTDSVVNTGNKIQAGNLSIGAYAYDLAEDGEGGFTIAGVNGGNPFKFETEGQDLKTDKNPIINDTLFEPGKSSAKLLKVENEGTLAAKIKLDFTVEDGGLMEALWFDFVKVENGEAVGSFTRRPMNTLETFAENLELPLLENGDNVQFILVYGMDENAGNTFKEKSFTADVAILATQYTKEEDGFGSKDYDAQAEYPVMSADDFKTTVTAGGVVDLESDVQVLPDDTTRARTYVERRTTMNLNGNTVDLDFGSGTNNWAGFYVNQTTMTLNGDGYVNAVGGYCFHVMGIRNVLEGKLIINGGTYYGEPTVVNVECGEAIINGGFFSCAPATNVSDDQHRYLLNCIDASYKNGSARITVTGGTFVNFNPANNQAEGPETNFVADGYTVVSEKQDNGDIWYTVVPE